MSVPAPDPGRPDAEPGKVRAMFGRIATRYDLANHLLSGGLDFLWRAKASALVRAANPPRILDLATGSGDLALDLTKSCPQSEVYGADFCLPMLQQAAKKGVKKLVTADAMALPFPNESFDAVTIGFGFRNMNPWTGALAEIQRVLAKNGLLVILDFSLPEGFLRPAYRWYLHAILPRFAKLCTGEREAYDYLAESIERFPKGERMIDLMKSQGFVEGKSVPLTFGVAAIYSARKGS